MSGNGERRLEIDESELARFRSWQAGAVPAAATSGFLAGGPLKLDLGCGPSVRRNTTGLTREKGWTGVDLLLGDGVDVACNLGRDLWPWPADSVDEVNCAHMLEHVPRAQRAPFFNELWRVLKPGAKATITTPHWASARAYGDLTHEWPPVSEWFWLYLSKDWRAVNAPHSDFACNFTAGYGYIIASWLNGRNAEYVREATERWKEAAQDMVATITKEPMP